jgi:hypothetical protein
MPATQNNWIIDARGAGSNATFGVVSGGGKHIPYVEVSTNGVSQENWQIRGLDGTHRPFHPGAGGGSTDPQRQTSFPEQSSGLSLGNSQRGSTATGDDNPQYSVGDPMDLDPQPTDPQADSRGRVFVAGDSINQAGTQITSQATNSQSGHQAKNSSDGSFGGYQKPTVEDAKDNQ